MCTRCCRPRSLSAAPLRPRRSRRPFRTTNVRTGVRVGDWVMPPQPCPANPRPRPGPSSPSLPPFAVCKFTPPHPCSLSHFLLSTQGDGVCDFECDSAACKFDDGDCEECFPGALAAIVDHGRINIQTVPRSLSAFVFTFPALTFIILFIHTVSRLSCVHDRKYSV